MKTRRLTATLVLAVTAPFALSACGTGFSAQTNQQYQASVGANLRSGPIGIYNGLFVHNSGMEATFSGALLSDADVTITKVSVTSDGGTGTFDLPKPIELKADVLKTLGPAGEVVVGMESLKPGNYVTVGFITDDGAEVSLEVPVVTRTAVYRDVARVSGGGPIERAKESFEADVEGKVAEGEATDAPAE